MSQHQPHPLADAAARRTLDAEQRVRRALAELDREGAAITFAAVARAPASAASSSTSTPTSAPRSTRSGHRGPRASASARPRRASENSLRARLRAALDDNQRLREEIARLRDELAIALGRTRELELAPPRPPMSAWPAPPAERGVARPRRRVRHAHRAAHRIRSDGAARAVPRRVRRRRRPQHPLRRRGHPPSPQRVRDSRRPVRQRPQGLLLGPRRRAPRPTSTRASRTDASPRGCPQARA